MTEVLYKKEQLQYLCINRLTNSVGILITPWMVITASTYSELDCPLDWLAIGVASRKDMERGENSDQVSVSS